MTDLTFPQFLIKLMAAGHELDEELKRRDYTLSGSSKLIQRGIAMNYFSKADLLPIANCLFVWMHQLFDVLAVFHALRKVKPIRKRFLEQY